MKNIRVSRLSLVLAVMLWLSSCSQQPRLSAPESAPPSSISASRYAPIEQHFDLIAYSSDFERVNSSMMEVLQMCESEDASAKLYKTVGDTRMLFLDSTVRFYMELLKETKKFEDKINDVDYNPEGKIISMTLIRE